METKFTKKEWGIDEKIKTRIHANNIEINVIHYERDTEEALANAKLIAAAPELYHALYEIIEWIKQGDYEQSFLEEAENALKKATE